jgi:hypothetical protein
MSKSARFFRVIWRVNAILFLVVAIAAAFAVVSFAIGQVRESFRVHERAKTEPKVVAPKGTTDDLTLNGFIAVEGTSTLRADLTSRDRSSAGSFSSGPGGYPETRNIFYLDLETSTAHWLLSTNDQRIAYKEDVTRTAEHGQSLPVATVVLTRALSSESDGGQLLVTNPTATAVKPVAANVTRVSGQSLTRNGDLAIVFEQARNYQVAIVDPTTLSLRAVHQVVVTPR